MDFLKKHKKAISVAFFFLFYNILKNSNIMQSNGIYTEAAAKDAILKLAKTNPTNAKIIERIYRWETAHFTSKQFKLTGSAGMEIGKWEGLPANVKSVPLIENGTGKTKNFIVWRSCYDFVLYLSAYIDRYNGNWARWYSTDPTNQTIYRNKVNSVKNRFI
jgi:hypothetical protein